MFGLIVEDVCPYLTQGRRSFGLKVWLTVVQKHHEVQQSRLHFPHMVSKMNHLVFLSHCGFTAGLAARRGVVILLMIYVFRGMSDFLAVWTL